MLQVILLGLKFGLLAIIYLFIIKVFYFALTELRRTAAKNPLRTVDAPIDLNAELVVTESNDTALRQGNVIKLGPKTDIGRGQNNQIALADTFVSHNHARIIFKQEKFYLEDLDSVNGTYINSVRVNGSVPLAHGDTIKIAAVTFKFVRWAYEVE